MTATQPDDRQDEFTLARLVNIQRVSILVQESLKTICLT